MRILGDFDEAEVSFLKALEHAPPDKRFSIHTRLAMMYGDRGDYKKAEALYAKACRSRDGRNLGWLWMLRGANLANTRRSFKRFERCFRAAMTMSDVDIDEAYWNLGYVLRAQGQYMEAREAFEEVLRLEPKDRDAKKGLRSLKGIEEAMTKAANIPKC